MKDTIKEKFNEYLDKKVITKLIDTEKDRYVKFFESTYKDNLESAKDNLKKHPRWCIIAGYYAMHDIAKLFLARKYNLKITSRVHFATIAALSSILKNKEEAEKTSELLKKAREIFDENILGIEIQDIPFYLKKGKDEREKAQYYNPKIDLEDLYQKANYFLNEIAIPFIKLFETIK